MVFKADGVIRAAATRPGRTIWNSLPVCLVKAIRSPRGDHTGVE